MGEVDTAEFIDGEWGEPQTVTFNTRDLLVRVFLLLRRACIALTPAPARRLTQLASAARR